MSENNTNVLVASISTHETDCLFAQEPTLSKQTCIYLHDIAQPLTIISTMFDLIELDYYDAEDLERSKKALNEVFLILNQLRNLHNTSVHSGNSFNPNI